MKSRRKLEQAVVRAAKEIEMSNDARNAGQRILNCLDQYGHPDYSLQAMLRDIRESAMVLVKSAAPPAISGTGETPSKPMTRTTHDLLEEGRSK